MTIALVLASLRDPSAPLGGPGNVIQLNSATDFCIFLPPNPNTTIASSEGYPHAAPSDAQGWAVAHCTTANGPQGSRLLYDSFVTGVHFVKTDTYVAISGTIDATKAAITNDGGGYYDLDQNVNSPPGGMCVGYDSYFNSIDPVDGIFCVKCCVGISSCRIDLAESGCAGMVGGEYTPTFPGGALPINGKTLANPNGSTTPKAGSTNNGSSLIPVTPAGAKSSSIKPLVDWVLVFLSIL